MEVYPETMKRKLAGYTDEARRHIATGRPLFFARKYDITLAAVDELFLDVAREGKADDLFDLELPFRIWLLTNAYKTIAERSVADANSFLYECWTRACWHVAGEKVFEVSPALSDHLWATDVRNVKCDLLKLPYRSLYIRVPRNSTLVVPALLAEKIARTSLVEGLEPTGEVPVEGMFITEAFIGEGEKRRRSWLFCVVAAGAPGKKLGGFEDKTFYTFEMGLPHDASVEQAIKARDEAISTDEYRAKTRADKVWRRYFEWAMNVMLYVTYEPNPDIEEDWANRDAAMLKRRMEHAKGPEKKRLKERLKDEPRRIYVGRHHCLLEDAEHDETARTHEGHLLTVRILVTGHWRNQPYGTGRQDVKLIWIRPYWKGPKGAPISNPRRIVT